MSLVLENLTLVDGSGADPQPDATVVVDDGAIRYAGPSVGYPEDGLEGAERVDGRGHTLFPGFIDCHVHLCFVTGTDDLINPTISEWRMLAYLKMIRNCETTLAAGVTSARDMFGMDAGFVQGIEQGLMRGPRLQTSVSGISATGGHFDFTQPCGFNPIQHVMAPDSFISLVPGVDEARDAARQAIAHGAKVLKVAATGGVISPADSYLDVGLTREEIEAVVEVASTHQGGLPVAAHAEGRAGTQAALDAGVRSIEHGSDLTDDQRQFMVDNDVFLVPTLVVNQMPEAGTVSAEVLAKAEAQIEMATTNFPKALAAGIKIAMGTDSGLSPQHGDNLRELVLMMEHGATAMQAVVAGTRTGAELMGTLDRVGTVEPGKRADLVLAAGDASVDLAAVVRSLADTERTISLVVKDGEIVADRRPAR